MADAVLDEVLEGSASLSEHLRLVPVETVRVEVETNAGAAFTKHVNPWRVREALWQKLSDYGPIPLRLDKPVPVGEQTPVAPAAAVVACALSAVMTCKAAEALAKRWSAAPLTWEDNGIPLRAVLVRQRALSATSIIEEDESRADDVRAKVPFDTLVLRSLPVRFFLGATGDVDDALIASLFSKFGDVRHTLVCVNAKHPSTFDLYVQFSSREQLTSAHAAFAGRALMHCAASSFGADAVRTALLSPRKVLAFFRLDVDRCGVFLPEPLCEASGATCVHTPVRRCRSIQGASIAHLQQQQLQQQQQYQQQQQQQQTAQVYETDVAQKRLCLMDRRAPPTDNIRIGADAPLAPFDTAAVKLSSADNHQQPAHHHQEVKADSPSSSSSPSSPISSVESKDGDLAVERPRKRRRGVSHATSLTAIAPASGGVAPSGAPSNAYGGPPSAAMTAPAVVPVMVRIGNPLAPLSVPYLVGAGGNSAVTSPPALVLEPSETERLRATSHRRASLANLLSHTDEAALTRDRSVHDQILRSSSAELIGVDMLLHMQQPMWAPPMVPPFMPHQQHQQQVHVPVGMMMPQQQQVVLVAAPQSPSNDERKQRWLNDRWAAFQRGIQLC